MPRYVYHWHRDGIIINSEKIICLGGSDFLPEKSSQAFKFDNVLGVQFHPEVTDKIIKKWVLRDWLIEEEKEDLICKQLKDHEIYSLEVKNWLKRFLDAKD